MDTESPITPDPAPAGAGRRRNVLAGALLGAVALTASVLGVSAIAGAQDDPTTEPAADTDHGDDAEPGFDDADFDSADWAAFDECLDGILGAIDEPADATDLSDADWEALEAQFEAAEAECDGLLPDEVKAEIAAWEPFDQCIDDQLGDVPFDEDADLGDEEWAALDAQFEAAEAACKSLLPAEALAEIEAFEAFDQCLADAGFGEGMLEQGPIVHIDTGDGAQIIEFGEATGTVTITGDANGVSVSSDGVTVVDESEIDAAFETCEQLLPDAAFFDDWDEGDWEDDDAWDEGDDA